MLRLLILTVLLIAGTSANGTSKPPVILTPKNISEQRHQIAVSLSDDGDVKKFHVRIGAKGPKTPIEVEWGYLAIYDRERFISASRTHAEIDKNGVLYEFTVTADYLARSEFSFSVATASPEERKKLPAGGGWVSYRFTLKDFASVRAEQKKNEASPPTHTADDLAPHASGVALVEVTEVTPYDHRPMDGNKGVSFKLKLVRGSGEFHDSIAVDTEFGGLRPPGTAEPKPSGPIKADSFKKGQRFWIAYSSLYEYAKHDQGVIAFWSEDDAKAAQIIDDAVKADRWKWHPQFHPNLGLTFGRLVEADKNQWQVRMWKDGKAVWETIITGKPVLSSSVSGFWDIRGTTSEYPAERPKCGHILTAATMRALDADNEFGLAAGTYRVTSAYDPETGTRRAVWIDAESPGGVQLVRRDYDPTSRLRREERFDWLEAGGKGVGAKTENWYRRIDRSFDQTTGKAATEESFRWDETKSGDERWVKIRK